MLHQTVTEHACRLIEAAPINPDPFPHIVLDGIFPESYYEQILRHLPAQSSLSIPVKFGMMKIEDGDPVLRALPTDAQQFWTKFDRDVKPAICRALLQRYMPYTEEKLTLIFGDTAEDMARGLDPNEFRSLRGIVQCRITGARMGAHVDKATSLFTYLFYFAPDDSLRPFGTIFYESLDRTALLQRYLANRSVRAWFPAANEIDLARRVLHWNSVAIGWYHISTYPTRFMARPRMLRRPAIQCRASAICHYALHCRFIGAGRIRFLQPGRFVATIDFRASSELELRRRLPMDIV